MQTHKRTQMSQRKALAHGTRKQEGKHEVGKKLKQRMKSFVKARTMGKIWRYRGSGENHTV
jgi:hypothetical protein